MKKTQKIHKKIHKKIEKNTCVLILHTGGTFGMDHHSPVLRPLPLSPALLKKRFSKQVPELQYLAQCEVDVLLNCDSAHIGPKEWVFITRHIQKKAKDFDGIVLLHGTDTLAYTASALSFLLRPCPIPIVITGAQRPLSAHRTDARSNLISAVEIAAHGPRPLVNQVTVFFNNTLFQGNRVRKVSGFDFNAFDSPYSPPLAIVGTTIRYWNGAFNTIPIPSEEEFHSISKKNVLLLQVTPSFPSQLILPLIEETPLKSKTALQKKRPHQEKLDAILLVVFQSWTAPTHDPDFLRFLKSAQERQIPIILCTQDRTQQPSNRALPKTEYAAGKALTEHGAYLAGSMTPECAYVKTLLLLTHIGLKFPQPRKENLLCLFGSLWNNQYCNEGK